MGGVKGAEGLVGVGGRGVDIAHIDLLGLVQGVSGKLAKWNSGSFFAFDPKLEDKVTQAQRERLDQLVQVGIVYQSLKQLCERTQQHDANSGHITQALKVSVADHITLYQTYLAQLEITIRKQMQQGLPNTGIDDFMQATRKSSQILYSLLWLVRCCQNETGVGVVDTAAKWGQCGDVAYQQLGLAVFQNVHKPLVKCIREWVVRGELVQECYKDFFIEFKGSAPPPDSALARTSARGISNLHGHYARDNLWYNAFVLVNDRVPKFLKYQTCMQIFRIGKSINFLKDYCSDASYVDDIALTTTPPPPPQTNITPADVSSHVTCLVNATSKHVNQRVVHLLFNKFKLGGYLQLLKKYFLNGQGDFMNAMISQGEELLSKSHTDVSQLELVELVEHSKRLSSHQYEVQDDELYNAIYAAKINVNTIGDTAPTGWDVLQLSLRVQQPVATVLDSTAIKQYYRIFTLIWYIVRTQHTLSSAWQIAQQSSNKLDKLMEAVRWHDMTCAHPTLPTKQPAAFANISKLIRYVLHLRVSFSQLLDNFHLYVVLDVIEEAWGGGGGGGGGLDRKLAEATNLDEVLSAHQEYLQRVLSGCYIQDDGEGVMRAMGGLLKQASSLLIPIQQLYEIIQQAECTNTEPYPGWYATSAGAGDQADHAMDYQQGSGGAAGRYWRLKAGVRPHNVSEYLDDRGILAIQQLIQKWNTQFQQKIVDLVNAFPDKRPAEVDQLIQQMLRCRIDV